MSNIIFSLAGTIDWDVGLEAFQCSRSPRPLPTIRVHLLISITHSAFCYSTNFLFPSPASLPH